VEAGSKLQDLRSLATFNFTGAMCLLFVEANPNRAPIGIFIGLGVALAIVLVALFLSIPITGSDLLYRGTNHYSGPFGGLGRFGGFGGIGGSRYAYTPILEDKNE
jgi:hypothetical protein